MLRLIVVDDEPPARRGLSRILQAYEDVEVVGEAGTLDEARELTCALTPDAIFLDIQLGHEHGFDLIERLDPVPPIIFVTAHSDHALSAFDVAALDFLRKPVSRHRVELTLERLRHHRLTIENAGGRRSDDTAAAPVATQAKRRLHIRMAGQSVVVPTDRIAMLAAEADFTRIVMADARDYLACRLLGQFDAELPTPPFFRISRSLVINLDRVEHVRSHDGGRTLVSLGPCIAPIMLGRAGSRRLRRHLDTLQPLPKLRSAG